MQFSDSLEGLINSGRLWAALENGVDAHRTLCFYEGKRYKKPKNIEYWNNRLDGGQDSIKKRLQKISTLPNFIIARFMRVLLAHFLFAGGKLYSLVPALTSSPTETKGNVPLDYRRVRNQEDTADAFLALSAGLLNFSYINIQIPMATLRKFYQLQLSGFPVAAQSRHDSQLVLWGYWGERQYWEAYWFLQFFIAVQQNQLVRSSSTSVEADAQPPVKIEEIDAVSEGVQEARIPALVAQQAQSEAPSDGQDAMHVSKKSCKIKEPSVKKGYFSFSVDQSRGVNIQRAFMVAAIVAVALLVALQIGLLVGILLGTGILIFTALAELRVSKTPQNKAAKEALGEERIETSESYEQLLKQKAFQPKLGASFQNREVSQAMLGGACFFNANTTAASLLPKPAQPPVLCNA